MKATSRVFFIAVIAALIVSTSACERLHGGQGAVLLNPRFEHGIPPGFTQVAGLWVGGNGRVEQRPTGASSLIVGGEPSLNDYTAQVRLRFTSVPEIGSEAGLVLQFRDSKNFIIFSLKEKKGGPYSVLRIQVEPGLSMVGDEARLPAQFKLDAWHELRADVHGVNTYCYLDGKHIVDFSFLGSPPPWYSAPKNWPKDLTHGQVGLYTNKTHAEFESFRVSRLEDFSHIVTPQLGRLDSQGGLLPRQSYAVTMRQLTEWMLHCNEVVDKSEAPAAIRKLPPYLITNFITSGDRIYTPGGEFAFNDAVFISGAVQYYIFTGDRRGLGMATQEADWDIANSTPAGAALPYLPPSFVAWQPDGSWKGQSWGLEPDKSAYLGISYLKLYAVTQDRKYLDAALRIGRTLRKLQKPDGSWPFRVNPRTGKIEYGYTSSQLWYVWFYRQLAAVTSDKSYLPLATRAFNWLMENPVKTNLWLGLYGDIASGAKSYDQWVPADLAMYLIDNRAEDPRYVNQAKEILNWLNHTLVVYPGLHKGIPGLTEQSEYLVVLTHHTLRLAELYAKLWEATGNAKYKEMAIQIANSVTWCLMSDGKMRQGFWYHAWGIPLMLEFDSQFPRIMACIPETAPRHENHLLETTSYVETIDYGNRKVDYRTIGKSCDVLTVVGRPKSVTSSGESLEEKRILTHGERGWTYNENTKELQVNHQNPEVTITF